MPAEVLPQPVVLAAQIAHAEVPREVLYLPDGHAVHCEADVRMLFPVKATVPEQ